MPFDQDINYRVRIDDADFQAKLSQMRSSVDMMMGSSFGGAGMFGAPMSAMMGNMGMMYMPGSAGMGGLAGGMADFGLQVRPITYTPPAIAMQPHFGMFQVQQSFAQAANNSLQPLTPFGAIPNNITAGEFSAYSVRQAANRVGDAFAIGGMAAGSFMAGTAGSVLGASAGTGLGGMIGGLAGGIFGGMAVGAYTGAVSDMAAQNISLQNALEAGSFRFMTMGKDLDPLTGRGFSRSARTQIAQSIQSAELRDVRYGPSEYANILETGMQMDLFSGTRDTEDFQKKFKDLVETVKVVTSTLHTTMREGMEAIRGMRDMGVDTPGGMMQMTLRSEMMGRMAGRTGMEMMAIGQAGAEMFRGTGVRMGLGFESVQNNVVDIRSMLNQGTLTRETVAQAGGELGLAQQMTASAIGGLQTAYGRAVLMGGFDPSTNGFRQGFIENLGGTSLMSLAGQVANLAGARGPAGLLQFQANQHHLISKLSPEQLQTMDMGMIMSGSRMLTQFGLGGEDAFMAMGLQMGKPVEVLEAYMAKLKTDPNQTRLNMEAAQSGMARQAMLEDFRNKYGMKAIGNFFGRNFVQPVSDFFVGIRNDVAETIENAAIAVTGGVVTDVRASRAVAERGKGLLSSGRVEGADIDISSFRFGPARLTGAGGESLVDKADLTGLKTMEFGSRDDAEKYYRQHNQNMVVLQSGMVGGITAASKDDYLNFIRRGSALDPTKEERARGEEYFKKLDTKTHTALEALRQKQISGEKVTLQDVITAGIKMEGQRPLTAAEVRSGARSHEVTLDDLGGTGMAALEEINKTYNFGLDLSAASNRSSVQRAVGVSLEQSKAALAGAKGILTRAATSGISGFFNVKDPRDIVGLTADDIADIGALSNVTGSPDRDAEVQSNKMRELRMKYGAEKAEKLMKYANYLKGASASDRAAFTKAQDESSALIGLGAEISEAATPGSTKEGVGGMVSATSSDQQKILLDMSNQLIANMQMLINMQQQFNAMRGTGGRH